MKMKRSNRSTLSLFLCMVLVVAMTLFTTGCNGSTGKEGKADNQTTQEVATDSNGTEDTSETNTEVDNVSAEVTVLGEGARQFAFTVTDSEGKETAFEIHTDKEMVGEALIELALMDFIELIAMDSLIPRVANIKIRRL